MTKAILCLKCFQKNLIKVHHYDYPRGKYFRLPATIIRHTRFRRYWREKCNTCGKSPLILIEIEEVLLKDSSIDIEKFLRRGD